MSFISREQVLLYLTLVKENLIKQRSELDESADEETIASVLGSFITISNILEEIENMEYYVITQETKHE